MIRKIVNIDKEKCNGCGLCVTACHEGAIELIDGRAVLISDEYCDGLGDCLPECPTGAIKIVEREAAEYNEELVEKRMAMKKPVEENKEKMPCGCPGTMAKAIKRTGKNANLRIEDKDNKNNEKINIDSELQQWPVQIKLVNTKAPYLQDVNLLIAGDCTAYAYGDFHKKFIKDRITLIGCPKLDDNEYYKEKIAEILKNNNIKSITVVRMEVPCCGGIVNAVKGAMLKSETIVPFNEVIISTDGRIK
ncbi:4Fe-4S dicluster domain-containing protein [Clostridium botulinum]|uniref:Iron-sulfur cluster-binding protein n=1 Tax=Clostridium botulinum (strain Okra / Type B1) TaxID=498213 RepID=B1ILI8_CLOBK|nr:4Fe-4S dicluster domain-containing protein [Clostridium botulinum]EKX79236.1 (Fe-S)-binding protein [Clostridium botulinum CFSAN001628]ACA45376.1 iron-sulfur cluster-binding protein [Clostridium botulinum B1 str. Okra]MBD5563062.1 4Fe-4S dicluster domain-containing protein [Clostridium botulinum]MBD5567643.1 4Fe-4S dicluster domain-containing protein [Clostridium botulinum]MBD5571856.1 4Fe-4S dicluster domain-containing protein [Clostridium botulinum]